MAAVAAALLPACSDDPGVAGPARTTTAVEVTTTAPPATAATAPTSDPPATTLTTFRSPAAPAPAENAAQALYDAWTRADRAAAGAVAQPAAVAALFARPWQAGDGWAPAGCTGAAGSLVCTWQRPGDQQVLMRVANAPATVAEVRFQP